MPIKKPILQRVVIYPKDIAIITGRKRTYVNELWRKIRKHYKKERHQFLTVPELCEYMGLQEEQVYEVLK